MRRSLGLRLAAASVGALALVGVAGAAFAEEAEFGSGDVDVNVEIAEITEPGVLAMTVAAGSTALTEQGSTDLVRQFVGTLPTVSITDTRTGDEIPDGAGWYVLGSSSGFTGNAGQPEIGAGNLGWTPRLIDSGDTGLIAEGDPVGTVMDQGADAVGLVDQELFAIAGDSAEVAPEGQWTATADLFLRTPATVAPGSYTGTVTLSLFE
ncbi:hypothetical protein [Agromyces aureus]|uniref:WxL domain-containing protein n=1 Tax=Agromyces aureus TaxID=453304 RepID=A0A191WD89_9MICO|nr:hypothetical protein [Agromyces aureus]ANJ26144.1 hypothetical protein ATC03_04770 [Agromyces aureus]